MNVEATVTLPEELLQAVDERSGSLGGRSQVIETALRAFLRRPDLRATDARDEALIDQHLEELNAEAEDSLSYQVPL